MFRNSQILKHHSTLATTVKGAKRHSMPDFPRLIKQFVGRTTLLILLCVLVTLLNKDTLTRLVSYALSDERLSYVLIIPFVCVLLVYLRRHQVFHAPQYCVRLGGSLILLGLALPYCIKQEMVSSSGVFAMVFPVLGLVTAYIGAFAFCFGKDVLKSASFPLSMLFLIVPLPTPVIEAIVVALQKSSADVAEALFRLIGVPVLRNGFQLALPGIDIEITEQCSGVRSALSLVLLSLVAGHLLLRSGWEKVCFTLITVPIVLFKNAVRIVAISMLGVYVDRRFFYGTLHRHGGLPFSLISLAIMGLMLALLTRRYRSSVPENAAMVQPKTATGCGIQSAVQTGKPPTLCS